VGTGTALGTTALEVVPLLDAAAALGGRPLLCVRASSADGRERHHGVSHHTLTALRLVRSPVRLAAPPELVALLRAGVEGRHQVVEVEPVDTGALLAGAGLAVTTMGRGPGDDPLFFAAAGASGALAGAMTQAGKPSPPG